MNVEVVLVVNNIGRSHESISQTERICIRLSAEDTRRARWAKPGRVRHMDNLGSKAKIDGSRFVKDGAIDLVHTITIVHRRREKLDDRIEKTWR